jgi:hypothetical protein
VAVLRAPIPGTTIDTLAYTKALEAAGVDRRAVEAQAEARVNYVLPELVSQG